LQQTASARSRDEAAGAAYVAGASRAYVRACAREGAGAARVVTPVAWARPMGREGEAVSRLADEVRGLRERLKAVEEERSALESTYLARIQGLEARVETLDRELCLARREPERPAAPSPAFLSRPLVIRSDQGEYLGVLGRGRKHFTMQDFVDLLEQNAGPGLGIDLAWERRAQHWVLQAGARETNTGQEQRMVLVVKEMVTPSRNPVVLILRFNIDGQDVSEALLLGLFRRIRSGLEA
jgi:hypothetical protein